MSVKMAYHIEKRKEKQASVVISFRDVFIQVDEENRSRNTGDHQQDGVSPNDGHETLGEETDDPLLPGTGVSNTEVRSVLSIKAALSATLSHYQCAVATDLAENSASSRTTANVMGILIIRDRPGLQEFVAVGKSTCIRSLRSGLRFKAVQNVNFCTVVDTQTQILAKTVLPSYRNAVNLKNCVRPIKIAVVLKAIYFLSQTVVE